MCEMNGSSWWVAAVRGAKLFWGRVCFEHVQRS
jgi:hypothetical protein